MNFPQKTPAQIREFLQENDPDAILFDGMDAALVGVATQFTNHLAVYDYQKTIEVFMRQGMDREGAIEWIEFNVTGAYLGEHTPILINNGDDQ